MDNDFDIEEFAKMFDAALASDNPSVQKALRNFMMVTALVHAQEEANNDERQMGPFESLFSQLEDLQHRISRLEAERYSTRSYPSPYNNTWVYNDPTTTSVKDWKYTSSSVDEYSIDVKKYMRDIMMKKGTG
jgi:hypothetical protein